MKLSRMIALIAVLFFLATGLFASGSPEASGQGAAEKKTYEWSLASVLPESHPVHQSLVFFAKKVEEKTGGGIQITVYGGGQLGQEKDYIEGVQLGTIDIAKVSSAPLGQFSESLQVLSLPFMFRNQEHQHAVLNGEVGQRLMADLEKNGFKGLTFLDSGFRSVTTKTKAIRTPEDLKGLKIRVMKSEPLIDTINAFSATAVPMGQSEVYVALQQGVIDGWENNEPTVIAFNMQEVAPYYSYTRHVSIPDIMIMNADAFNGLPADYQKAIMDAAAETAPYHTKIWNDYVNTAKSELAAKGMKFNEVNNIKDFQKAAAPIYDQYGKTIGRDLIDAIINQ